MPAYLSLAVGRSARDATVILSLNDPDLIRVLLDALSEKVDAATLPAQLAPEERRALELVRGEAEP